MKLPSVETLQEEMAFFTQRAGMEKARVVEAVDILDANQAAKGVYQTVIGSLTQERGPLGTYREVKKATQPHTLKSRTLKIRWGVRFAEKTKAGEFIFPTTVNIRPRFPNWRAFLQELATTGNLPFGKQVEAHERVHFLQEKSLTDKPPVELEEAQAYRAGGGWASTTKPAALAEFIMNSPLYEDFDHRRLDYAIMSVDRLNALGVHQDGIAEIFRRCGGWNDKRKEWHDIEAQTLAYAHKLGYGKVDFDELVRAYFLQLEVSMYRTMFTTQAILEQKAEAHKKRKT